MKRSLVCSALVAVTVLAGACSEPEERGSSGPGDDRLAPADCSGEDLRDCVERSTLAPYLTEQADPASGPPLVLGMMNTESSPAGSYTELSEAVMAAAEFVNAELGGVDGRPVEVRVCDTGFSAEGSVACGQRLVEEGVPVVLGGIDVFGNGIEVLEDNGIPFVGGIPISAPAVTATNSFQWSGGTWGATVAFADHAERELGAERVAIVFGEFAPITQSAEFGRDLLQERGVEVDLVPSPITAADIVPAMQAAAANDPDAIIVLGADTGCRTAFEAISALGIGVPTFHTGACAAPSLLEQADPRVVQSAIFNVEGPISMTDPDPDTVLYGQVVDRYGDGLDPVGAGTVSFRSFVNLYMALRDLGPEAVDAESVTRELRTRTEAPSFMGHPYTCDGEQFDGLPALCSPQQILVRQSEGELVQIGSWIDVGALRAG